MVLLTAAASTLGIAGIAAAASLLGGILGALAGGASDLMVHRRQQRATARAGARLLCADLAGCAMALRIIEEEGRWYRFLTLTIEAWDNYRNELAIHLSVTDWTLVVEAVTSLKTWSTAMSKVEEPPAGGLEIGSDGLGAVATMLEQTRMAYNALAQLAETPPVPAEEFGRRSWGPAGAAVIS